MSNLEQEAMKAEVKASADKAMIEKAEEISETVKEGAVKGYKSIEKGVVGGYKKIEDGEVAGYKKI